MISLLRLIWIWGDDVKGFIYKWDWFESCVCVCLCVLPYPAKYGHQVMLAHGEHVDVFHDHHLIVVFVEDGVVQDIWGEDGQETETV